MDPSILYQLVCYYSKFASKVQDVKALLRLWYLDKSELSISQDGDMQPPPPGHSVQARSGLSV